MFVFVFCTVGVGHWDWILAYEVVWSFVETLDKSKNGAILYLDWVIEGGSAVAGRDKGYSTSG